MTKSKFRPPAREQGAIRSNQDDAIRQADELLTAVQATVRRQADGWKGLSPEEAGQVASRGQVMVDDVITFVQCNFLDPIQTRDPAVKERRKQKGRKADAVAKSIEQAMRGLGSAYADAYRRARG